MSFYPTSYTTKVALKQVLGMIIVLHLNQNIVEVCIYGDQMKFTVLGDWGLYTGDWGVYTNVKMDDVNHPCSVEHRNSCGNIWNTITGKLNHKNKFEGFSFVHLT